MDFQNKNQHTSDWQKMLEEHKRGKIVFGTLIVLAGIVFLLKKLGFLFPEWLFTWKMLLIVIGIGIGLKHSFRNAGWLWPFMVGLVFLIGDLYPSLAIKPLLWPMAIIAAGLFIIFKPRDRAWRHHRHYRHYRKWVHDRAKAKNQTSHYAPPVTAQANTMRSAGDEYLEATSIMGGISKKVISKHFKGGEITTVMGSSEIDLSQADFEGTVSLSITQIMGGTKLIVPPHWIIRSEFTSVIASIEDLREVKANPFDENAKILLLEGTSIMGGLEISSYA